MPAKELTDVELQILVTFAHLEHIEALSKVGGRHWEMTSFEIAQTLTRFRDTKGINHDRT